MNLSEAMLWLFKRRKTPEITAVYRDTLPEHPGQIGDDDAWRVSRFSRGSVLDLAAHLGGKPCCAVQMKVCCEQPRRVQQTLLALPEKASLWRNGEMIEYFEREKMGVNLITHPNAQFVRNTTRLNIEHLENGAIKIIPITDKAYVGVATLGEHRTMRLQAGKIYTLSFEYQGNTDNFHYCYLLSRSAGGTHHLGRNAATPSPDTPNVFTLTFVAPFSADDVGVMVGYLNADLNAVALNNIRLEMGAARRVDFALPAPLAFDLAQGENEIVWLVENGTVATVGDFIDDVNVFQAA